MTKAAAEVKQENRLVRYFKETRAELRKVHWPTRKEARNLTLIVLAVTLGMSVLLGVLDLFFNWIAGGVLTTPVDVIRLIILVVLAIAGAVLLVVSLRQE